MRAFARHGVPTISSDEIVHRLLREDTAVKQAVIGRFGDRVVGADGEIDRGALAGIVFSQPDELRWLEALLHPAVAEEQARWRAALAALPEPPAACAAEIPLLYETGGETRFDVVVVVTAPSAVREARIQPAHRERREARLLPDEEKARRADFSYVNDGSLEDLDRFVASVLAAVTGPAARERPPAPVDSGECGAPSPPSS